MSGTAIVVVPSGDGEFEEWDDPRGVLSFHTVISAHSTPTKHLTAGVAVLPPGGWLGPHRHAPAEVYHVVDGEGLFTVQGKEHVLRPGTSVYIPGGEEHEVRNAGPASLRFFYAFATDSFTDVHYEFSDEAAARVEAEHSTG